MSCSEISTVFNTSQEFYILSVKKNDLLIALGACHLAWEMHSKEGKFLYEQLKESLILFT